MTSRVSVALLGAGHFFHAPHWAAELRENPRAEFAALWDHDQTRARALGARWGVPVEPDLDRLLARPGLRAVAICSENDLASKAGRMKERGK
jgi:predicted dehydrogenase